MQRGSPPTSASRNRPRSASCGPRIGRAVPSPRVPRSPRVGRSYIARRNRAPETGPVSLPAWRLRSPGSSATAPAASVRVVNFSGYVRRDEIGLTLAVPGKVWSDALDPAATGMARELGLPEAVHQSVGRGHQIRYEGLRRSSWNGRLRTWTSGRAVCPRTPAPAASTRRRGGTCWPRAPSSNGSAARALGLGPPKGATGRARCERSAASRGLSLTPSPWSMRRSVPKVLRGPVNRPPPRPVVGGLASCRRCCV